MVTIRLSRIGKKNHPQFRVVAQQRQKSPKGKFIEALGFYHPTEKKFECDVKKIEEYIKNGAHVSSTLARLLKSKGVAGADRYVVFVTVKPKKKEEKADEVKAEEPQSVVSE